ncbi:MAG: hydantoinase/oxoprolinase family protein, partial [Pseudomonadota bacterium]
VSFVVTASAPVPDVQPTTRAERAAATGSGHRTIVDTGAQQSVEAAVHPRATLTEGARISGPALIVEDETTTVVTSNFHATMAATGDLLLTRSKGV